MTTTPADLAQTASELRLALIPLVRQLRQQAGTDLTPSLVSALATVAKAGPLSLGELAAREHVSQPMISRVAATLVDQGLASRVHDPADQRVVRLELTEKGRRQLDRSRSRKNAWLAKRLQRLDDDELATLLAAIPVIERITEESP